MTAKKIISLLLMLLLARPVYGFTSVDRPGQSQPQATTSASTKK